MHYGCERFSDIADQSKLQCNGARRFVIWGYNFTGRDFADGVRALSGSIPDQEIILCDRNQSLRADNPEVLSPRAALETKPDALFVFVVNEWLSVRDTLDQLNIHAPHVVYADRKPRKTLIVSIIKSGTHLVMKILSLLGVKATGARPDGIVEFSLAAASAGNECYVLSHGTGGISPYDVMEWASRNEVNVIFNYRDPRDTLLSMANFYTSDNVRFSDEEYLRNKEKYLHLETFDDVIRFCLDSDDSASVFSCLESIQVLCADM